MQQLLEEESIISFNGGYPYTSVAVKRLVYNKLL